VHRLPPRCTGLPPTGDIALPITNTTAPTGATPTRIGDIDITGRDKWFAREGSPAIRCDVALRCGACSPKRRRDPGLYPSR